MHRLTLSNTDIKLAGVCAGIAEFFGVDPSIVRVLWILFILLGGSGVIAYFLFWLIMPRA